MVSEGEHGAPGNPRPEGNWHKDGPGTAAESGHDSEAGAGPSASRGGWDDGADWTSEPVRWTLEDEYPELTHLAWMSLDAAELRPLLVHRPSGHLVLDWLHDNGCYLIGDVLAHTDEEILEWPGIGIGKQQILLGFFRDVAQNALPLLAAENRTSASSDSPGDPSLSRIAAWAQHIAGAFTWGQVEKALAARPIPDDIRHVLAELRERPLPPAPETAPASEVVSAWIADLDSREVAILRGRVVKAPAQTLDEIGQRFSVSRERVRQLEEKLSARVTTLLQGESWRSVRWHIFDLRERLGSYAPLEEADELLDDRHDELTSAFLLWLSGYRTDGNSLTRDGYTPPTASELPRLEADLPLLDEDHIRSILVADGVRPDHVDWAINSIKGIHRFDGRLVLWSRSVVEKSLAILVVRGAPMTPDELAAAVGEPVSLRSLRQRLYEDPRMCRVTRSTIGLRTWGGEEYTSLVGLMRAALEDRGPMTMRTLIDDLVTRFDASASSILAYSQAPAFVVEGGVIRLRGPGEPFYPRVAPERVPGLYRDGSDCLVWNITADHDLMRGSGRAIPIEIADFLGISPGDRVVLASPVRAVPISWLETSHVGPNLGSLKALAEESGAQVGDHLRLRFDKAQSALWLDVSPDRPQEVTISGQVAWLTGLPPVRCGSRASLANAAHTDTRSLIDVLRARGDHLLSELASQLP
jgi:hypothetical protein